MLLKWLKSWIYCGCISPFCETEDTTIADIAVAQMAKLKQVHYLELTVLLNTINYYVLKMNYTKQLNLKELNLSHNLDK